MDEASAVASRWLAVAAQLGWGIEGPVDADGVQRTIEAIGRGDVGDDDLVDAITARELAVRPVDALFESAGPLIEACEATGTHREELLSAARGWLHVAVRHSPK